MIQYEGTNDMAKIVLTSDMEFSPKEPEMAKNALSAAHVASAEANQKY